MAQCYNSPQSRRRRKLPNVQRNQNNSLQNDTTMFWYSYQSALHWIRNHEDTISKCIQLLQIYPNLIQDASLDAFWEFIEPLVLAGQKESKDLKPTDRKSNIKGISVASKSNGRVGTGKAPDIPHISVTESSDLPRPTFSISAKQARTPRVHLISRCQNNSVTEEDRLLHTGVIDMLQEDFYVRVANASHLSRQHHDKIDGASIQKPPFRHFIIAESDVCVYLFNDATLDDASCFHDLCTALAQRVPIVYVRYHKKQLPKTFCETVQKNSKGCLTLKDYADKYLQDASPAPPSSPPSPKNIRSKNRLAPLTVTSRPCSATELSVRGTDGRKVKHNKHSPFSSEIDLVFTLVSNFKNANVFDETDLDGCSTKLKHAIYKMLGIYETKPQLPSINTSNMDNSFGDDNLSSPDSISANINLNLINNNAKVTTTSAAASPEHKPTFLSVPDPEDLISTREWGNSGCRSAPPHGHPSTGYDSDGGGEGRAFLFGNDVRMVSPSQLEQRATTYLIFDRNKTPDGPRRVEFPPRDQESVMMESDLESDENEPAGSPIDFNEIDLSREVNARGTPESDISSSASLF